MRPSWCQRVDVRRSWELWLLGRSVETRIWCVRDAAPAPTLRPKASPGTFRRTHTHTAMLIVHVHVHVLPDAIDRFIDATRANARESAREPGVVRFDVVQQDDDPTRVVL